jgi:hypothetical protein
VTLVTDATLAMTENGFCLPARNRSIT